MEHELETRNMEKIILPFNIKQGIFSSYFLHIVGYVGYLR